MLTVLRRVFSFSDWNVTHPKEPPPGDMLDASFDAQDSKINEIAVKVEGLQREDGKLHNGIVSRDTLSPEIYGDLRYEMQLAAHNERLKGEKETEKARISAVRAEKALSEALNAEISARADAKAVSEAKSGTLAHVSDLVKRSEALLKDLRSAEAALSESESHAGHSEAWAYSSALWAEHMPDTLPDNALKMMDITGDHWSARWWANRADNAFGRLTDLYLGAWADPPTTNLEGGPIEVGSIYYNTETHQMYVWTGDQWETMTQPQRAGLLTLWYSSGEGQTVFPLNAADLNGSTYTMTVGLPEGIDCHVNGVKVMLKESSSDGDWTVDASTSTVTFLRPLRLGDLVSVDVLMPNEKLGPGAVQAWSMKLVEAKNGVRTVFTLATKDVSGPSVTVNKNEELLVSLDGVVQEPGISFNASGSSITFAAAPAADAYTFITWFRAEAPDAVSGVEWNDVLGKPATFPPTLPIAQSGVTNLTSDLTARVLKAGDTMTGNLVISTAGYSGLYLYKPAVGAFGNLIQGRAGGLARWVMYLGDTATESGSETGSNFQLLRYNDAGALNGTAPISIPRNTGIVQMPLGATTGLSTGLINYGSYSGTPISTLVPGTTSGGLIEGPASGHLVVGIRNNDANDSFSVVSYGATNVAPYSRLAMKVTPDGTVTAGATPAAGDNTTKVATTAFVATAIAGSATAQTRNRIVNPAMQISQEIGLDTVGSTVNTYIADQWKVYWSNTGAPTFAVRRDIPPPNGEWSLRLNSGVTPDASVAAGEYYTVNHLVEGRRISDFKWGTADAKAAVFRLWARSSITGTFCISLRAGPSGSPSFIKNCAITANVWTEFAFAVPPCTIGTWPVDTGAALTVNVSCMAGTSFNGGSDGVWAANALIATPQIGNWLSAANQTLEFTNVGLYLDPLATGVPPPWQMPDADEELLACQRYYLKDTNTYIVPAYVQDFTYRQGSWKLPVPMRSASPAYTGTVSTGTPGGSAASTAFAAQFTVSAVGVGAGTAASVTNIAVNARM